MMTHEPRYNESRYSDRPRKRKPKSFLDDISLDWYLAIGSIAVAISACQNNSITSYLLAAAWLGLCAVVVGIADGTAKRAESKFNQYLRNYGKTGVWGILFGVCALTSLFLMMAEPSHAQFLAQTNAKLVTRIGAVATGNTAQATTLVNLVFSLIRGLMIVVLIIFAWKIFQARDDQEDMKNLARTPVLMLVVSAMCDGMSVMF
jgi:hypothetical protein